MKRVLLVLIFTYGISLLMGQDYSTPKDGNLLINDSSPFVPENMEIYNDDEVLVKRNLVLKNNRIYENVLGEVSLDIPNRTLNTDIVWINNDTFVALTGNSERYLHGILGDKIESTGFEVYKNGQMTCKYELPNNSVFETLRPLIVELVPENPGKEIILTSSNEDDGARVEVYSQTGLLIGQSPPIGRGYRWLHVLGGAPFNNPQKMYIVIVKTPHLNGILELLSWNGSNLESEVTLSNNLSTHQIGSSNLNMALLINMDSNDDPEFLIPTSDFRNLLVIKYEESKLTVIKKYELPGRIVTNIYFEEGNSAAIWIGLSNGSIVKIFE